MASYVRERGLDGILSIDVFDKKLIKIGLDINLLKSFHTSTSQNIALTVLPSTTHRTISVGNNSSTVSDGLEDFMKFH
uniref:Uncharacterized protein n=1 Tax=Wuchereria bancrofti TaxID=6293 RepID=A0A1I8EBY3_WUCBA